MIASFLEQAGPPLELLMLLVFLLRFSRRCFPWDLKRPHPSLRWSPCRLTGISALTPRPRLNLLASRSFVPGPRRDLSYCQRARLEALYLSTTLMRWPNLEHSWTSRTLSSRSTRWHRRHRGRNSWSAGGTFLSQLCPRSSHGRHSFHPCSYT